MPHAPPVVAPPPVLMSDWKILVWLAFTWSKLLDLNVCPASTALRRFYCATDKLKPTWFWGPNQKTVTVILRSKSPNRSCRFWGPNWKTVDLGFEVQPRRPRCSSPCARCRPHTTSPNIPIVGPSSTRHVLDHPRSSAPCLILLPKFLSLPVMSHLLPAYHEASKHDSPHEQR
jgi:hypothetical protein